MLVAVLDIGSNSVRLVLYQCAAGHAQPVFNEKELCILGQSLNETGKLSEDAKALTRKTIARFKVILEARKPAKIRVLATAAIRLAQDGKEFAKELGEVLGHPVHILTGMDEAVHAASGVLSASYQPSGLVVDMGGGSIELARIDADKKIAPECSLPIGSIAVSQQYYQFGSQQMEEWLSMQLEPCSTVPTRTIHAVGGSFRSVARHHMKRNRYPFHIIHDYTITRHQLLELLEIMQDNERERQRLVGVRKKRERSVIPAAIVLNMLMHRVNASEVVFSSSGIREGALYIANHEEGVTVDPLIAMVRSIGNGGYDEAYIDELTRWILLILAEINVPERLVRAFCEIAEIATAVHPDYRAEYAFNHILSMMGYGMKHDEQVMLALALYHRHRTKVKREYPALALISQKQRLIAYVIGQVTSLAYRLSAGSTELLQRYHIELSYEEGAVNTLKVYGGDDAILMPDCKKSCDGLGETICALMSLLR